MGVGRFAVAHGAHRPVCGGRFLVAHVGGMNCVPWNFVLFTAPVVVYLYATPSKAADGAPATQITASLPLNSLPASRTNSLPACRAKHCQPAIGAPPACRAKSLPACRTDHRWRRMRGWSASALLFRSSGARRRQAYACVRVPCAGGPASSARSHDRCYLRSGVLGAICDYRVSTLSV